VTGEPDRTPARSDPAGDGRLPGWVGRVPGPLAGLIGPAAVIGAAAGVVAAGVAVGVAAQRAALRQQALTRVEEGATGPADEWTQPVGVTMGSLRGTVTTVRTDDGVDLQVDTDEAPDAPAGDPTVVLVHGFGLNADIWHFQRAALRGRHRLVVFDQRGHGRSGLPSAGSWTIDRLGLDLAEVLRAAVPTGPVVLVGHSMGGMAILALARARPDLFGTRVVGVGLICSSAGDPPYAVGRPIAAFGPLDALGALAVSLGRSATKVSRVVTNTTLQLAGQAPAITARARGVIQPLEAAVTRRTSFARPVPARVAAFAGSVIASTPVAVIAGFYLSFFDMDLYASTTVLRRVATLVASADQDRVTPAWHSAELAARLPDAEVVELEPAGHMAFLEYPARVSALVEDLVQRAAGRSR